MNMGESNIMISNELENRFRRAVALECGARRGVIGKSLEEAIESWIKSRSQSHVHEKTEIISEGNCQY
jgi:hypothetical protein